jgi:hypothetical protein
MDGLFGKTPWQIQQGMNQQINQTADNFARMSGDERANAMAGRAGGMLVAPVADAMGWENPEMANEKRTERVMSDGGDLSTSKGVLEKAKQFFKAGDIRTATALMLKGKEMEKQEVAAALAARKQDDAERRTEALIELQMAQAVKALRENPNMATAEVGVEGKPGWSQVVMYDKTDPKAKPIPIGAPKQSAAAMRISLGEGTANDLDESTVDFMARQALTGDISVLSGLAKTKGALTKVRSRMAQIAPEMGITPEKLAMINAEYFGVKAGQRTLATRTSAIELAASEASKMMQITRNISKGIDQTQYPSINAIKNAVDRGTGGEAIVRLNTSLNSLINVYARAVNPTGVATVADKQHARELIDSALSNGQLEAALQTMELEMQAALAAPAEVQEGMRNRRGVGDKNPAPIIDPNASRVNQIPTGNTPQRIRFDAKGNILP